MIYLLADPARGYYSTQSTAEVPSNAYRRLSEAYGGPCCGDAGLRYGIVQAERLGLTLVTIPTSALVPASPDDVPAMPPLEHPRQPPVAGVPPVAHLFTFDEEAAG